MDADQTAPGYKIWGVDGVIYGPVELPMLVNWVKDERVVANTWIYCDANDSWQKAGQIQELQMFFRSKPAVGAVAAPNTSFSNANLKPGALRRVKILADMKDAQLERFAQFMEVKNARQWTEIVKQGETGDAMYLVLEGELRVRLMIDGKETILAQLSAGDFFGEMALFDHGPRSADVIANEDSVLLKISGASFEKVFNLAPELAAPFLLSISKTLAARIRADNKRFKDSVSFARASGA
jgi:delta 1-pyrroline-5-carboxylate dehydrogenase